MGKGKELDRLWADHYWWTRAVITDAVYGLPCLGADLKYLLYNQYELGKNFASYTNSYAGEQLATTLAEHINIAVQLVKAAIAHQNTAPIYEMWQINAAKVALIYAKYGKKVSKSKITSMMMEHLTTTLAEAQAIISKNCNASIAAGDAALHHIQEMSDYLVDHL